VPVVAERVICMLHDVHVLIDGGSIREYNRRGMNASWTENCQWRIQDFWKGAGVENGRRPRWGGAWWGGAPPRKIFEI